MRYLAAYMLATMGGNAKPTVADIERILSSVGIECDKGRCQDLIDELSKRPLDEIIASGEEKLATVPLGGGGGGVVVTATAAAEEAKPDAQKEEAAKEESGESSDDDMGFGLFD